MKWYVADWEANGLRPDATQIWCGVIKEVNKEEYIKFSYGKKEGWNSIDTISQSLPKGFYIMHNGVQYDRWLLKKLANVDIPIPRIIDTLLLSKLLWPDLKVPAGWKGKAAPYSIEAWGMRSGRSKPEQEQWNEWEENMLHRCMEDVLITEWLFNKCLDKVRG